MADTSQRCTPPPPASSVAPLSLALSLPTLALKPSWLNRAGRIDRSACVELRASDIWREVRDIDWRQKRSAFSHQQSITGNARAPATAARGRARSPFSLRKPHLIASARFTVHAELLAELHDGRRALQLSGDHRSVKSNAMKTHLRDRRTSIAPNPNRGGNRIKKLGVWSGCDAGDEHSNRLATGWTQTVHIERWRLHDRLAQHFLICPRCLLTQPPHKHLKLLMPLATAAEIADARLAEGWVKMLDARQIACRAPLDRDTIVQRAKLLDRYGAIMRDRELICRKCLGVRYGEVKWHRLNRREATLQARHQRERAHEESEAQAEREVEQKEMNEQLANALGEAALREAHKELEAMRAKRARRDRANARRRAIESPID